jgi:hypothetical protein
VLLGPEKHIPRYLSLKHASPISISIAGSSDACPAALQVDRSPLSFGASKRQSSHLHGEDFWEQMHGGLRRESIPGLLSSGDRLLNSQYLDSALHFYWQLDIYTL